MGSKHISWRRGRRSESDQIWRDIFPPFLFDLRLYASSVSVIRCISNEVYLTHLHLFINKKSRIHFKKYGKCKINLDTDFTDYTDFHNYYQYV